MFVVFAAQQAVDEVVDIGLANELRLAQQAFPRKAEALGQALAGAVVARAAQFDAVKGKLFEVELLEHLNSGGLPDGFHAELAASATIV